MSDVTRLILIRHGQSEGNARSLFLGHTDLDLTPLGLAQAEAAARFLDPYPIDVIYASDLLRARHTAEALGRRRGMEVIDDPAFREIYAGDWEGRSFDEIAAMPGDAYRIWHEDFGAAQPPHGESVADLYRRVTAETERLLARYRGKTVCVGTHATPVRLLRCYFLGVGLAGAQKEHWPGNAGVNVIDISPDGSATFLVSNETGFLGAPERTDLPKNI